ncbi:MAG: hypothetical protein D8M58_21580 [Calditrichaeota bacterium]|nr:MAG: hypothetical protein DWQ03_17045 [Calditrichota bacterium]MBL1208006.1 hypothetical protein [Calditrichota bacterium]NOG47842.1 hypothetical protein [Calditrichota bacterium]
MEIAFKSKKLRDICQNELTAKKELGYKVSTKLKHRLADIRAAGTIFEIVVGNPRELLESKSNYIMDIGENYIIRFSANHVNNPRTSDQKIDWKKVTRIKILSIEENE